MPPVPGKRFRDREMVCENCENDFTYTGYLEKVRFCCRTCQQFSYARRTGRDIGLRRRLSVLGDGDRVFYRGRSLSAKNSQRWYDGEFSETKCGRLAVPRDDYRWSICKCGRLWFTCSRVRDLIKKEGCSRCQFLYERPTTSSTWST